MAVFRVAKNKGYTVMSNYHLNDKNISLKSKGLLSQMLSLPETWDFTLRGLAYINKESIDAIRTAVLELEEQGYITRKQGRDAGGKLATIEYTIYEQPQPPPPCLENPITVKPRSDKPCLDNPYTDNPTSENPTQVITNRVINQKETTDSANIHQSIYPAGNEVSEPSQEKEIDRIDRVSAIDVYRDIIKDNIEYDILCTQYDPERMTEILELMLEIVCSSRKTIRIGREDFPAEVVKSRFMKLGQFHIEYVFDCISKNTTKVYNIKSYMLTTLYNAPATMSSYYTAEVNHDLYGSD